MKGKRRKILQPQRAQGTTEVKNLFPSSTLCGKIFFFQFPESKIPIGGSPPGLPRRWFSFFKFKEVNDEYGHDEGDALLRSLARNLSNAVRTNDIVCRLGGDEFLVICPRCSQKDACAVAEKILTAPKNFCNADGVECWSGAVSIGVAQAEPSMTQPEQLLKAADRELDAAKRKGGGTVSACPEGEGR